MLRNKTHFQRISRLKYSPFWSLRQGGKVALPTSSLILGFYI